jgi:retinol dehydrogenase 12
MPPSFFGSFVRSQLFTTIPVPTTSWQGKTVIVTGSNVGLGKEAVRHFVRLGASKVIMAVRSVEKGESAKREIAFSLRVSLDVMEVWKMDLTDYDSIKAFAERCNSLERLDAVVENAGLANLKFEMAGGYEASITTNVISTSLLALLLLPKLKTTAVQFNTTPHLTIVGSEVIYLAAFKERTLPGRIFDNLNDEKQTNMLDRYNVSKLLLAYVFLEWARLYMSKDYPITVNLLTPGLCKTTLDRHAPWYLMVPVRLYYGIFGRSAEHGSRILVNCASAGRETHGKFLWDCKPKEYLGELVSGPEGPALQRKTWEELRQILENIQPGVTTYF